MSNITNGSPVEGKRIKIINGFNSTENICNTNDCEGQIGTVLRYNYGSRGDLLVKLDNGIEKRVSFPDNTSTCETEWVEEPVVPISYIGKKVLIMNYSRSYNSEIGIITGISGLKGCCFNVLMDDENIIRIYRPTNNLGNTPQCEMIDQEEGKEGQEVILDKRASMLSYIGKKAKILPIAKGDAIHYIGEIVTITEIQGGESQWAHGVLIVKANNGISFNVIAPTRGTNSEIEIIHNSLTITQNTSSSTITTPRDFEPGDKVVVLPENNFNRDSFDLNAIYEVVLNDHSAEPYYLRGTMLDHYDNTTLCKSIRFATPEEVTANHAFTSSMPNTSRTDGRRAGRGRRSVYPSGIDDKCETPIVKEEIPVVSPYMPPSVIDTSNIKGRILDCIINNPGTLGVVKNEIGNRKYYDRIVNSILPYKVGIEIECIKSLSRCLNVDFANIIKKYSVVDFSDDQDNEDCLCENRICFNGHKQVVGLYNILALMTQHCILDTRGGIHYHIDFPEIRNKSIISKDEILIEELKTRLNDFQAIFHYKGTYNDKEVSWDSKGKWINCRPGKLGTIEIRIASPSFDYSHIIREIIAVSKIITEVRSKLNMNKYKL